MKTVVLEPPLELRLLDDLRLDEREPDERDPDELDLGLEELFFFPPLFRRVKSSASKSVS